MIWGLIFKHKILIIILIYLPLFYVNVLFCPRFVVSIPFNSIFHFMFIFISLLCFSTRFFQNEKVYTYYFPFEFDQQNTVILGCNLNEYQIYFPSCIDEILNTKHKTKYFVFLIILSYYFGLVNVGYSGY